MLWIHPGISLECECLVCIAPVCDVIDAAHPFQELRWGGGWTLRKAVHELRLLITTYDLQKDSGLFLQICHVRWYENTLGIHLGVRRARRVRVSMHGG